MGQAKRRKQALGDLYGTPEGSNRQRKGALFGRDLVAFPGVKRKKLDAMGLQKITTALAAGEKVLLIGTHEAQPLATAAGLPWLHELDPGEPLPQGVAWDLEKASSGGPQAPGPEWGTPVVILGAGSARWLEQTLLGAR